MNKQTTKKLLSYLKPYKSLAIFAAICAIGSVTMTLYAPILVGRAIDLIIGPHNVDFEGVFKILCLLAGTVLVGGLFTWGMQLFTNKISYKAVRDMRKAAFAALESVDLSYVDTHSHGDIISRIQNDADSVSEGLLQGLTQLLTGAFTIIGTLLFMLSIDLKITLVVVMVTPLSLFVAAFIAKMSRKHFIATAKSVGEISGYVDEMLTNQRVIKQFGWEESAQEGFEELNAQLYKTGVKSQLYSSLTNPSTRFVNGVVFALVGIIGALGAINGRLSLGDISAFLTYANQYTKPFNEISGVVSQLQSAYASAARLFELTEAPQEKPQASDAEKIEHCDGVVDFEDVSFSYTQSKKLIENFSLHVDKGQNVAIVGPTGCGKTTLINLLMRFYDVSDGRILVDGKDIRGVTRDSLRGCYGMVLQDSWIFGGTVRENIAYSNPNASDDEIKNAAKRAFIDGFIERLPQGYDTYISEGADSISTGQKQLLCIARALLSKPEILILDEATSSIDTLTELNIQRSFADMMRTATSFIVAHRLSTIQSADLILVMREGNIVEKGTHEALLKKNGFYRKLYDSQYAVSG